MRQQIVLALISLIVMAGTAVAEDGGREKASAMLSRVVAAVQQDEKAALKKFSDGTDGFRDGTIYPFCFRISDGIVLTGQTAGQDIRTFPGSGQQLFEAAQKPEDVVTEIAYMARRPPPDDATPAKKVSLVRRIGQIGCGVGYYP
jgi:hypothetical protein